MEIHRLRPGDEDRGSAAAHLFDQAPVEAATKHFLARAGHHILIAFEDAAAVGFITGVEMTHPDKGTEMFIYEMGVDEKFRRRGVGKALIGRLSEVAKGSGCYGMWVLTDDDNAAALAAYRAAGATQESPHVMLSWEFAKTVSGA